MNLDQLSHEVIGAAMQVHRVLGPGFLESVYRNALLYELGRREIAAEPEKHLKVVYDHVAVGSFIADIIINKVLILELKAASALSKADEQQLVNYLKATGIEHGLLINFGQQSLQFRHKFRDLPLSIRNEKNTNN